MDLITITRDGIPARSIDALPDIAVDVMKAMAGMYHATGYQPPWLGYLALEDGECVGTCAFKTPPVGARVEIAYFTFPGHEGRGVATSMARHLVEIAFAHSRSVRVFAQTLPQHNASTRVLEKLGFQQTAEVDHPEDGTVWEWEQAEEA